VKSAGWIGAAEEVRIEARNVGRQDWSFSLWFGPCGWFEWMRGAGQHNPNNYAGESHRGNLGGAASDVDGGERGGDAVRCDDVSDQSRQ
jgi:hypothetical protein